jgi:fermentation-respiration switch protein FrsA (DUF1100 family)
MWLWMFSIAALSYASIVGGLYVFQRKLIYTPWHRPEYAHAFTEPSGAETVQILTEDGLSLRAWHYKAQEGNPTILYFHGNSGLLEDRIDKYQHLAAQGYGVLALSWRGFGKNPGNPSEQGLYTDARAAITYATAQGISPAQMIFYGESLGTGVAVQMATETTPRLLVLEAPYTSLTRRAQEMHWYAFAGHLIEDKFDSLSKAGQVSCPVLVLHGAKDKVIPLAHGEALYAAFTSRKHLVVYPDRAHVDFDLEDMAKQVAAFDRVP